MDGREDKEVQKRKEKQINKKEKSGTLLCMFLLGLSICILYCMRQLHLVAKRSNSTSLTLKIDNFSFTFLLVRSVFVSEKIFKVQNRYYF